MANSNKRHALTLGVEYALLILSVLLVDSTYGRIHKLELKNDNRRYFTLSTFGFYKNGNLEVQLKSLRFSPFSASKKLGFTLEKTMTDASNPYVGNRQDKCMLEEEYVKDGSNTAFIFFSFDFKNKVLQVNCSLRLHNIAIYQTKDHTPTHPLMGLVVLRRPRDVTSDNYLLAGRRRSRGAEDKKNDTEMPVIPETMIPNSRVSNSNKVNKFPPACDRAIIELGVSKTENNEEEYSANFTVAISTDDEEGLYNLHFHNCPNYHYGSEGPTIVNLSMIIIEKNSDNFLSAGEMPLPALYFTMSILFFLSGCFWVFILHKSSKVDVYITHYLMAVLVYIKSLSLLFHGINYHFIERYGTHIEGWAILYYITHLLRGALMFLTIILIGTGWAFIKRILSEKEKKIFMIVIPLQVLANVAEIIMEESEEGETVYTRWREVFFLVDLLCCGAILFPVVWSIRHLQDAYSESSKAAINLRKLKLFQHFYIMIVCYIYSSRIIVYILRITVPFQYEWLNEMLHEMATFVFYVLTGYKFRPANDNPYFHLSQEDPDDDVEEVITQIGDAEGFTKINRFKPPPEEGITIRMLSNHGKPNVTN